MSIELDQHTGRENDVLPDQPCKRKQGATFIVSNQVTETHSLQCFLMESEKAGPILPVMFWEQLKKTVACDVWVFFQQQS